MAQSDQIKKRLMYLQHKNDASYIFFFDWITLKVTIFPTFTIAVILSQLFL